MIPFYIIIILAAGVIYYGIKILNERQEERRRYQYIRSFR